MVAETKETMTKMFDCWNEGFRATLEAGRRAQETWAKAFSEMNTTPLGFEAFFTTGERMAREFAPFVGKNMETFAQTCDTAFRANLDVFKAATEVAAHPEDGDFYKRSRRVFDVAFDAMRTNVDAFSKAAARSNELCSAFYRAVCTCCPETGKSASPKSGKSGA